MTIRSSPIVQDIRFQLLNEGKVFCCINTDLANPTTNRIYPAIGYRPVCDTSTIDLNAGEQAVAAVGGRRDNEPTEPRT